jgi:hypothetical protein
MILCVRHGNYHVYKALAVNLQVAQEFYFLRQMIRRSEWGRIISSTRMVTAVSPFFCVPHMHHDDATAQRNLVTLKQACTLEAHSYKVFRNVNFLIVPVGWENGYQTTITQNQATTATVYGTETYMCSCVLLQIFSYLINLRVEPGNTAENSRLR